MGRHRSVVLVWIGSSHQKIMLRDVDHAQVSDGVTPILALRPLLYTVLYAVEKITQAYLNVLL